MRGFNLAFVVPINLIIQQIQQMQLQCECRAANRACMTCVTVECCNRNSTRTQILPPPTPLGNTDPMICPAVSSQAVREANETPPSRSKHLWTNDASPPNEVAVSSKTQPMSPPSQAAPTSDTSEDPSHNPAAHGSKEDANPTGETTPTSSNQATKS